MKNNRLGHVVWGISVVVAIGMIALVWLVIEPSVWFSILFTVFVVVITAVNGRKAFGTTPPGDQGGGDRAPGFF